MWPDGIGGVEVSTRPPGGRGAVVGGLGDVHRGEHQQPAGDQRDGLDPAPADGGEDRGGQRQRRRDREEPMSVTTLATLTSMLVLQPLGDVGRHAVDPRLAGC